MSRIYGIKSLVISTPSSTGRRYGEHWVAQARMGTDSTMCGIQTSDSAKRYTYLLGLTGITILEQNGP